MNSSLEDTIIGRRILKFPLSKEIDILLKLFVDVLENILQANILLL